MNLSIKQQVYNTLCNHENCTSGGVANLLNVPRFTVLRALSELVKEGLVKVQKGRIHDGWPEPRWRSYKLKKEKYSPIQLFE